MKKNLNSNQLKLIAVCAMIFDHLLWIIESGYNNGITFLILHTFGRIVAPIFAFYSRRSILYA